MGETAAAGRMAKIIMDPGTGVDGLMEARHLVRQFETEVQEAKGLLEEFQEAIPAALGDVEGGFRRSVLEWLLGDAESARTAFRMRKQNPAALFFLGLVAEEAGDFEEALESFRAAAKEIKDSPLPAVGAARVRRKTGSPDAGLGDVQKLERKFGQSAEVYFEWGRCLEEMDRLEEALDEYEKALSFDPDHAEARFRAAYNYDLRGEDEKAVEYYKRISSSSACFRNAMMNLGLLYEDSGDLDRAIGCFREVLRVEPNNARARLYLANALSATDERVDEIERRERERLNQVLKTPVTDFELSVRSRNCLARMNIETLGDLVKRTESEMLAYKNFGETSLREVKAILGAKGLRLGMGKEEEQKRAQSERLRLSIVDGDNEVLLKDISELELSVRSRKCMSRLGAQTLGELITKSEADLLATKNFGQTSLMEVKQKLAEFGLSLKPTGD